MVVHAPLSALHLVDRVSSADGGGRPSGGAGSEARRQLIFYARSMRRIRRLQISRARRSECEAAG
jgi:hypothetical protein